MGMSIEQGRGARFVRCNLLAMSRFTVWVFAQIISLIVNYRILCNVLFSA